MVMKTKVSFWRSPIWYVIPCVVFLLVFVIAYPFGYNIYNSLFSYSLTKPDQRSFVGLGNFINLFHDKHFLNSIFVTVRIVLSTLVIEILAGLGIALLLDRELRGKNVFRTLFMLPLATVPVINGYLFKYIFFPGASVVNDILMRLGLIKSQIQWLNSPLTASITVICADCWQWIPFVLVIILAGLESIPMEPYELAKMDGMSPFKTFSKVTLPRLKPVLTLVTLIRLMDLLRLFDTVFAITAGGPRSATETIAYYIYRTGFKTFNVGKASASSLLVWIAIYLISFITIRRVFGVREEEL